MKISKEVKAEIKMYQSNDWNLEGEEPTYYLLSKNTANFLGHVLVFFVFGWWTVGVANLVYHVACNKKKKVFK